MRPCLHYLAELQLQREDYVISSFVLTANSTNFNGHHFTAEDTREDYAEPRFITVGTIDGRMVVMVWTPRGEARRIISMRKANEREITRYGHRVK